MEEINRMDSKKEKRAWREVRYDKKFVNAFRGFHVLLETTPHFVVAYMPVAFLILLLGFYFHISNLEWIALTFSIGFVFVAEAINTAFEIDIDLTSPEYHPFARDTKDVSAAAVLLAIFIAVIVGLIIFLPLIIAKFF